MQVRHQLSALAAAICALWCQGASALVITFDYSYDSSNFFDASRESVLQEAGNFLGSRIRDDLTAINSQGANNFTAGFRNPSDSSQYENLPNYNVAANTLVVYVGAQNYSGVTLAEGGFGGYSVSGTQEFVDNAISRGQARALATPAHDFGPWGGKISFNSSANWYFDSNPYTHEAFSGTDFFSVALHELGHVLGFGLADSWDSYVTNDSFCGPTVIFINGECVTLSSDEDHAHWLDGTMSPTDNGPITPLMVPSIAPGTRRNYSYLDTAALKDIGWQMTIPEPATFWLVGTGLLGLLAVRRRKSP